MDRPKHMSETSVDLDRAHRDERGAVSTVKRVEE